MAKIVVLVPFPLDEEAVANRRAQTRAVDLGPDIEFEFLPVKAGPALLDSHHDWMLGDLSMYEAGLSAAERGCDAICIDTMSDSGMNALRSVLDIPVIGPGKASYAMALLLGQRFSILTQWDPWMAVYRKTLRDYGLEHLCASIRSIDTPPDLENLLGGKEEVVFPKLVAEGMRCVQDGADVICLGSTTMHQAHGHLTEHLPVPVINPGPVSYKLAEAALGLGLSQSRVAYRRPDAPKDRMVHAMLDAAVGAEEGA